MKKDLQFGSLCVHDFTKKIIPNFLVPSKEERIFIYDNLIYSYSKQQNYKGT